MRSPLHPVEADVADDAVRLEQVRQAGAAAFAPGAPHLEDIREVRVEPDHQRQLDALEREIRHPDPLDAAAIEQQPRPQDVDLAVAEDSPVLHPHIGVGQIGGEDHVVLADRRAQMQWQAGAEQQPESREKARAVVEQPLFTALRGNHVAAVVEHAERIAVLQHPRRDRGPSLGNDFELFGYTYDGLHRRFRRVRRSGVAIAMMT